MLTIRDSSLVLLKHCTVLFGFYPPLTLLLRKSLNFSGASYNLQLDKKYDYTNYTYKLHKIIFDRRIWLVYYCIILTESCTSLSDSKKGTIEIVVDINILSVTSNV